MNTSEATKRPLLAELSDALADAAARVAPSIVQVHGRPRRPAGGIVIAPGRVVTTAHSVEWDEGLKVRNHEGRTLAATVVGSHPGADLTLLDVPGLDNPALAFGRRAARIGELTLLSGRSWRGDARARLAMISGVSGPAQLPDGTRLEGLLVLSWSPYPGFSGSAVTGADGALLGIATAGLFRGTAVAVPGAIVEPSIDAIARHGGVRRGFLGVSSQPVRIPRRQRGALAQESGLLVLAVSEGGPADAAGLMVGDIMVEAAGAALASPEDLLAQLTGERVGHPLEVRVLRGEAVATIPVTVGERPRRA